jgi:addiction module RelE/StbE family toxin
MAQVIWAGSALKQLREIDDYLSERSPDAAATVVTRLSQAPRLLETTPRLGRCVPEFGLEHVRELVTVRPYRIIYLVRDEVCEVVAVVHSSRNLASVVGPDDFESS